MKYLLAMFLCFMVYLAVEASEPKLCYVPVPSSDMEADSSWVNESATKQDTLTKKKSLLTRFLDYFNDANKIRSTRNSTSVSLAVHTTVPTPSWALDSWQPVFTVPTPMTRFFLHPMYPSLAMSAP